MDAQFLIETYGLAGLIIFALGAAVVALWRRVNHLQDARMEDQREAARELREIAREAALGMESLRRVVEEVLRRG